MILSAILSFFGGTAFRMIWGEISSFVTKWQDHKQEIERMELQGKLDIAAHDRNLAGIKIQADLGIKTIQVQGEVQVAETEAQGWLEAVKATATRVGIVWIDSWNAVIRPATATWALTMMTLDEFKVISMSENAWMIASAALGIYLADRTLFKRGK